MNAAAFLELEPLEHSGAGSLSLSPLHHPIILTGSSRQRSPATSENALRATPA